MSESTRKAVDMAMSRAVGDSVDLADMHAGVAPDRICVTCQFQKQRMHNVSVETIIKTRNAGGDVRDLACRPDRTTTLKRITADALLSSADEPSGLLGERKSASLDGGISVEITRNPAKALRALVSSCGQLVREDCRRCIHFKGDYASIVGGTNANGKEWRRDVLVGGTCKLPTGCDFSPKPMVESERSCFTCANNMFVGSHMAIEHGTPVEFDLTPAEMAAATRGLAPEDRGLAVFFARKAKSSVLYPVGPGAKVRTLAPFGTLRMVMADVVEAHTEMVQRVIEQPKFSYDPDTGRRYKVADAQVESSERIVAYTLRFPGSGHVARLDVGDNDNGRVIVAPSPNPMQAFVEVFTPHHRDFGLPDNDRVHDPIVPPVASTPHSHAPMPHLVDPDCNAGCTPGEPCAFHRRAPYRRVAAADDGSDIVFERPEIPSRHAQVVSMDLNEITDPALFRVLYRSLWRNARTEAQRKAVLARHTELISRLPKARKPRNLMLAWTRPVDPTHLYKNVCSLNLLDPNSGIDFRAVMGDYFGDPRANQHTNPFLASSSSSYFSWSKYAERMDWERVTSSGERTQEERMANLYRLAVERTQRGLPLDMEFTMPAGSVVTKLPLLSDPNGEDINTTEQFVEWLDSTVTIPGSDDEEPFVASRRWEVYGYELFRSGKRDSAKDVPEVVTFNHQPERATTTDEERAALFHCTAPQCGATYSVEELEPMGISLVDPRCNVSEMVHGQIEVCDAPLLWFETQREERVGANRVRFGVNPAEPHERKAPTLAGGPDSSRWQNEERLLRMECPGWAPRWGRRVGYSSPNLKEPKRLPWQVAARKHMTRWIGKIIDVSVNDVRMKLKIVTSLSPEGGEARIDSPLVQALFDAQGASDVTFEVNGEPVHVHVYS